MTGTITIAPSREKPILNHHPWIFSGAIQQAQDAVPGAIVDVVTHKGAFLARGYWNPKSQIQVRILTWEDEPINDVWWQRQLQRAVEIRAAYHHSTEPRGYRLVNAENDYIPGLVIDRYGDYLVLQALTLYIDQQKQQIAEQLATICRQLNMPIKGIYERSDVDVRKKEGLGLTTGLLWGEEPPELIEIVSGGKVRLIDIRHGHKTGYYLDQLHNQNMLPSFLASHGLHDGHTRILNLFSYTGGFGLATQGHVTNVDASRPALELAEAIYERNQWEEERVDFIQADVFDFLRDQAENGELYDVVILDPP
ncbi:MAG: class I SAM-dependent rRNA methyltransferase, partial [Chloroflexi bacterium]